MALWSPSYRRLLWLARPEAGDVSNGCLVEAELAARVYLLVSSFAAHAGDGLNFVLWAVGEVGGVGVRHDAWDCCGCLVDVWLVSGLVSFDDVLEAQRTRGSP